MSGLVSLTKNDAIGIISIDNPPVNALSPGVPEGILSAVQAAEKDDSIKALVLIGSGRTFIAGADIKEFAKMTDGQMGCDVGLQSAVSAIEDSPKPIVCAIHGTAFGGGLEVAMACHYRVALASAQVGQPEVRLGLIPCAGGTQRLPRLAGVLVAVEMCAGGNSKKAAETLKHGLVDRIIEGDLLQGALAFVRDLMAGGGRPRKTRDLTGKLGDSQSNSASTVEARCSPCLCDASATRYTWAVLCG